MNLSLHSRVMPVGVFEVTVFWKSWVPEVMLFWYLHVLKQCFSTVVGHKNQQRTLYEVLMSGDSDYSEMRTGHWEFLKAPQIILESPPL